MAIANLEALKKQVAVVEEIMVQAGLREITAEIQQMNEKMTTIQGNWEAATTKFQELDSEAVDVRAQLHRIIQEWERD